MENKIIYKYMPVNDHGNRMRWIERLMINKELFCSHYLNLNDPFERPMLATVAERNQSEFDRLKNLLACYHTLSRQNVCSFSDSGHNSELMWSHYAQGWSGIRVLFTIQKNHKLENVIYLNKHELYSDSSDLKPLLVKRSSWSYEDELRFITSKNDYEKLDYIGVSIFKVQFGMRMDKNLKIDIINLCNNVKIEYQELGPWDFL